MINKQVSFDNREKISIRNDHSKREFLTVGYHMEWKNQLLHSHTLFLLSKPSLQKMKEKLNAFYFHAPCIMYINNNYYYYSCIFVILFRKRKKGATPNQLNKIFSYAMHELNIMHTVQCKMQYIQIVNQM